jgi:hypothetical protein
MDRNSKCKLCSDASAWCSSLDICKGQYKHQLPCRRFGTRVSRVPFPSRDAITKATPIPESRRNHESHSHSRVGTQSRKPLRIKRDDGTLVPADAWMPHQHDHSASLLPVATLERVLTIGTIFL